MLYIGLILGGILGSFMTVIIFTLAKELVKENKSGAFMNNILTEDNIREKKLCIH